RTELLLPEELEPPLDDPPPLDEPPLEEPVRPIREPVCGPTMPSAVRPWLRCHRWTAARVAGPKPPSALPPTLRWIFLTLRPRAPWRPRPLKFVREELPELPELLEEPEPEERLRFIFEPVRGPTTPSATRLLRCCHRLTAARVAGPKTPSALTPTLRWIFFTV